MIVTNGKYPSIEQAASQYLDSKKNIGTIANAGSGQKFANILADKAGAASDVAQLKFSKHASGRLSERNIELTDIQKERLSAGMQAAGEKGINETLVMVDQLAFIVNVKNQTVITALAGNEGTANVFTNIDGAVIA